MSSIFEFPEDRYVVLVEFVYKHLNFHEADLESILDMHGITLNGPDCQVLPLPNSSNTSLGSESTSKNKIAPRRSFWILSFPIQTDQPRSYVLGDSDAQSGRPSIATIISRCTLVRGVMELWGVGTTIQSCASSTRHFISGVGKKHKDQNSLPNQTWKMTVHTLGTKYTREELNEMRAQFAFLNLPGEVRMKDPSNEYLLIREIELDAMGSPLYPRHHLGKTLIPENDARPPLACYFGRVLAGARNNKGKRDLEHYSLKKRSYLGPTSMDAEISFIMTDLAQVQRGSFVFDPFVGTGSILLSCAIHGAYCMGSDIDIRVLRGRSKEENVFSNFEQFGLPRPELVRSDNAIYHRHYRTQKTLYDAILCDPPYGIRAGAKKTGSKLDTPRPILDEHRHDHIAQTRPYAVSDVMSDLVDMAARTLVMGGRLVYIMPSFTDFDAENDLPRHQCLQLLHTCYQSLSSLHGRTVVVMKKTKTYDVLRREEYMAAVWKNGPESAEKCANIREKILEVARQKPDYEEKAAIRKQKRKEFRQAKKRAKLTSSPSIPGNQPSEKKHVEKDGQEPKE